ncbi:MAG: hypothetical protein OEM60_10145 [Gammaproteobacteria bacterium]|nr:hypothetical protein [Gammaproteobacteria bacterium]MDH3434210.1 hypothetical protein [Gammaproteobacteria bacterium]
MRIFRIAAILALFVLPAGSWAEISSADLPNTSKWYFHADFEEMRSTEAGQQLYGWLQDEVFDDIREDVGIDFDKEADFLTAFATDAGGLVVLIDGNISQKTQDKLLAMGAASGGLDKLESGGRTYYHVKGGGEKDLDIDIESFENGAFVSFAIKNKLLVTSSRESMQGLLADKGRVTGIRSGKGAMFVLSAERSLMQAGANTGNLGGGVDWDSNILRNTEHAAILIADKAGKIAVEVQLVTKEKEMADSLASIVRGLISLQVFNDDLDPEIASFLQNTSVDVNDNRLTVKVALDPDMVVAALD